MNNDFIEDLDNDSQHSNQPSPGSRFLSSSAKDFFSAFSRSKDSSPDVSDPKRVFDTIDINNANPQIREFLIHLAALIYFHEQESANGTNNELLLQTLLVRALNYSYKYSLPRLWDKRQLNPMDIEAKTHGYYHRFNQGRIDTHLRERIAARLDVPSENIALVTDTGFNIDAAYKFSKIEELTKGISDIVTTCNKSEVTEIVIDITPIIANLSGANGKPPSSILTLTQKAIRGKIYEFVSRQILENFNQQENADFTGKESIIQNAIEKQMASIDKKIKIACLVKERDQSVAYTGKLIDAVAVPSDGPSQAVKVKSIYREPASLRGYIASPNHLAENSLRSIDEMLDILSEHGVDVSTVQFPEYKGGLERFDNLQALLNHPTLQSYADLSTNPDNQHIPYLKTLPKAFVALLTNLEARGQESNRFEDRENDELFQFICNRVIVFMQRSLEDVHDMPKFMDQYNLLHEELNTLVATSQLFTLDDLSKIMEQQQTNLVGPEIMARQKRPMGDTSTEREGLAVNSYLKNAGMRCVYDALRAAQYQKNKDAGLPPPVDGQRFNLRVAHSANHYWELIDLFKGCLRPDVQQPLPFFSSHLPEHEGALELLKSAMGENKIDVYFCEFHAPVTLYPNGPAQRLPVLENIKILRRNGLLAEKCHIMMDLTTVLPKDIAAIRKFIQDDPDFKGLNIIGLRSGQKFDMLGQDNAAAGLMTTINSPALYGEFEKNVRTKPGEISNVNLQIVSLQQSISDLIDEYRLHMSTATAKLMGIDETAPALAFPKEMFTSINGSVCENNENPIQIFRSTDEDLPYLQIVVPDIPEPDPKAPNQMQDVDNYGKLLANNFIKLALEQPNDMPVLRRPSFGFSQECLAYATEGQFLSASGEPVKMHLIRLQPGLEDDQRLKNFRDLIVIWNDTLAEIRTLAAEQSHRSVERILYDGLRNDTLHELVKYKWQLKQKKIKDTQRCRETMDMLYEKLGVPFPERPKIPTFLVYRLPPQFHYSGYNFLITLFAGRGRSHSSNVHDVLSTYQADLFAAKSASGSTTLQKSSPDHAAGLDNTDLLFVAERPIVPAPDQPFQILAGAKFQIAKDASLLIAFNRRARKDPLVQEDTVMRIPPSRIKANEFEVQPVLIESLRNNSRKLSDRIRFRARGVIAGALSESDQAAIDAYFNSKDIRPIPKPTVVPNNRDVTIQGFPILITERNTVFYHQPNATPPLYEVTLEQLEAAHRGNRINIQRRIDNGIAEEFSINGKSGHINVYRFTQMNAEAYGKSSALQNQVVASGKLSKNDQTIIEYEFHGRKNVTLEQPSAETATQIQGVPFHISERGTVLYRQQKTAVEGGSPEIIEAPIAVVLAFSKKQKNLSDILYRIKNRSPVRFEIPPLNDENLQRARTHIESLSTANKSGPATSQGVGRR